MVNLYKEEYSYNDMKRDLQIGREFEFIYNGVTYYLSRTKQGWILVSSDGLETESATYNELLENIFDNKNIKDLWDKIEIVQVFLKVL
ncbi:hypothetical protein ACH33_09960 [Aneurinibacillus sp. XH2]|nr:hypothetical protein ACH33_09960 [Aneurinibacillus sp. XH2]